MPRGIPKQPRTEWYRLCLGCQTPLRPYQKLFCSARCAMKTPATREIVNRLVQFWSHNAPAPRDGAVAYEQPDTSPTWRRYVPIP